MIITGIVPLVIISSYLYSSEITSEISHVTSELSQSSEAYSDALSISINEKKNIISNISHSPNLISLTKIIQNNASSNEIFLARMALDEKLLSDIDSYNWVDDFVIIDSNTGKIIFDTNLHTLQFEGLEKINLKESFNNVTSTEIFASDIPIRNEHGYYESGVPTMLISAPIKSEVGTSAVLSARINVFKLVSNHELENMHFKSQRVYFVNSQGYFLSMPNNIKSSDMSTPELHLKVTLPHSSEMTKIFNIRSLYDTVIETDGYLNYAGSFVVGAISPVKGTDWFYITEATKNEVFQNIILDQQTITLATIILVSVLILTSIIFTKKLLNPLMRLQLAVSEITSGKYVEIEIKSSEEFEKLYSKFNEMSRSLKNNIEKTALAELKYRTIYENSPEMYRTVNTDGILLDCNIKYAETLGYSKNELIGSNIFEHTAEKSLDDLRNSLITWKNLGSVKNRDVWMKRKDGSIFPTLISATTMYDKEKNTVVSNTAIKDMSEIYRAKTELEEQKMKRLSAIGELSARIAHDLRNPLSVIKNSIDMLRIKIEKTGSNDNFEGDFDRIQRSVWRITHQIEEVLDYVKPKPLELSSCSLIDVLDSTLERIVKPEGVEIFIPKNDSVILIDPEKMEVVFSNLITNAIQAMNNKGQITINIIEENENIIVTIKDTGPGIPDDLVPQIFDPLFTTRQVGTGLGLVSVKSIIEKHGGEISVKTKIGEGTTFIIKLKKIQ